ncbi:DNA pilot protein [Dipodfec virus UOA04_Rod_611]|nr:DNA pilot protein [Dipodfec virus UOA04_Rod_611]
MIPRCFDLVTNFFLLMSIIGSAIGTLGNLFQQSQANKWNEKQLKAQLEENQKNRDFNHSEAEIARNFQADFAREMFDKTNQWNSVSHQVSQLKTAGINPALAYSGNSFSPASMPSVSPSGASSSGSVSPTQYNTYDTLGAALSIERQRAEISAIEAQTQKTKSETEGQGYQNDILRSDASFRDALHSQSLEIGGTVISLNKSSADLSDSQLSKVRFETELLQKQLDNYGSQVDLLRSQIEMNDAETVLRKIDATYRGRVFEATIDRIVSETGRNRAEVAIALRKLPAELAKLRSEARSLDSQSVLNVAKEWTENELAKLYGLKVSLAATDLRIQSINAEYAEGLNNGRPAWLTATEGFLGSALNPFKGLVGGSVSRSFVTPRGD